MLIAITKPVGCAKSKSIYSESCTMPRADHNQCDDRRPVCSPCVLARRDCCFPKSEKEIVAQKLEQTSITKNSLNQIVNLLRQGTRDESIGILNQIRAAKSVNDFINTFSDASLLLRQASSREYSPNNHSIFHNLPPHPL